MMILYLKKSFGLQGFHKKIQRFKGYCLDIGAFQCWVFGHSTSPSGASFHSVVNEYRYRWRCAGLCTMSYQHLKSAGFACSRGSWNGTDVQNRLMCPWVIFIDLGPFTWLTLPLSNHMTESVNHHPPFCYEMRLKTRHSFCCNSTVRMLWHVGPWPIFSYKLICTCIKTKIAR